MDTASGPNQLPALRIVNYRQLPASPFRRRSDGLALRHGLHPSSCDCLRLRRRKLDWRQGLALERRIISLAVTPEAEAADFETQPPGGWLLDFAPWTEAEHRISAVGADRETAAGLGLADGAPCLRLERRTWRDGQGVTWASQIFPGAAYDLVARFSPTKG